MKRFEVYSALVMGIFLAAGSGCSVSVTDAGGGGGGGGGAGGGPTDQPADTDGAGGAGGGGDNGAGTATSLVESTFADPEVATATRFAGGGVAAKRQELATLYPRVNDLIAGGSEAAEAMLDRFAGQPGFDSDEQLFVFAYAIEQMDYFEGVERLVTFLEDNVTGEVDVSRSAATHAIRQLLALPTNETAYYLGSEIEQTIADAGGTPFAKRTTFKGDKKTCWQEFVLLRADGTDATYPAGHAKAGQPIVVGGNVIPTNTLNEVSAEKLRQDVTASGGTYVDLTENGVDFPGQPDNSFNCAGFVFYEFNGGKWLADPGSWYDALKAAGVMEQVTLPSVSADTGNFVFYFNSETSTLPAHVARVKSNSLTGDLIVQNADGPTGLFEASWDAAWFYGKPGENLSRYLESRTEVWRWVGGATPKFRVNTDRSVENSCHGEDNDGDIFPEAGACVSGTPRQRCISPEFLPPTYQIFRVTNYAGFGYLTVRATDTLDSPPLLSTFPGGGIDGQLLAEWEPFTGEEFATPEEAAQSICPRFVRFYRPVLASFIQSAFIDGEAPENSAGVDGIFVNQCPDVPNGF